MKILLVLWLTLFGVSEAIASSQEDTISIKAEIDKAFLTIGERAEYRISVTHDPSVEILSKIVPPPSDVFEIKEVHDFTEKEGKRIAEGRRFILTTYELGEFILEPVEIRYRMPSGEEKTAQTNRIYLTVRSVDSSGKPKTDIRGPKGVLELQRQWAWLWFPLLVALLAVGVGVVLWRRWTDRSLREGVTEEPVLSPEDEALLRLNRLFDSDLLRQGKLKEYFLQLSEILRRFFERRFEILAIESTTSEILRDLQIKETPPSLLSKIKQVLDAADLVKFAKWKPALSEIIRINQMAKALVEEARPQVPASLEEPK